MVQTDQDIRQAVYAAQQDTEAADALIRQYLPFIRGCAQHRNVCLL